jgi:hypothetical protein
MFTILKKETLTTKRRVRGGTPRHRGGWYCRLTIRRANGTVTTVYSHECLSFGAKGGFSRHVFRLDGVKHTIDSRYPGVEVPAASRVLVGSGWNHPATYDHLKRVS